MVDSKVEDGPSEFEAEIDGVAEESEVNSVDEGGKPGVVAESPLAGTFSLGVDVISVGGRLIKVLSDAEGDGVGFTRDEESWTELACVRAVDDCKVESGAVGTNVLGDTVTALVCVGLTGWLMNGGLSISDGLAIDSVDVD